MASSWNRRQRQLFWFVGPLLTISMRASTYLNFTVSYRQMKTNWTIAGPARSDQRRWFINSMKLWSSWSNQSPVFSVSNVLICVNESSNQVTTTRSYKLITSRLVSELPSRLAWNWNSVEAGKEMKFMRYWKWIELWVINNNNSGNSSGNSSNNNKKWSVPTGGFAVGWWRATAKVGGRTRLILS